MHMMLVISLDIFATPKQPQNKTTNFGNDDDPKTWAVSAPAAKFDPSMPSWEKNTPPKKKC